MPAIKFGNASSLLAVALALGSTSAALAQEPPLEAQASRTATFDIPSQPLAQALTAFGRQSGMQIAVDTAAVAGKTSGSVNSLVAPSWSVPFQLNWKATSFTRGMKARSPQLSKDHSSVAGSSRVGVTVVLISTLLYGCWRPPYGCGDAPS